MDNQEKPKKKFYESCWFWTIIIFVGLMIIGSIGQDKGSESSTSLTSQKTYNTQDKVSTQTENSSANLSVKFKEDLNSQITLCDSLLSFDPSKSDLAAIGVEATSFSGMAKIIDKTKNNEDKEIQDLGNKLKLKLIQVQIKQFPLLRKTYGKLLKNELWENDIDVEVLGSDFGTLDFTGASFAINKNIKETHAAMQDVLRLLRFDRVNYRWSKYTEYTYFDLNSPRDSEVIINQ